MFEAFTQNPAIGMVIFLLLLALYVLIVAWVLCPVAFAFKIGKWKERFKALFIWAIPSGILAGTLIVAINDLWIWIIVAWIIMVVYYMLGGAIVMGIAYYLTGPLSMLIDKIW